MSARTSGELEPRWAEHAAEWRDPAQVAAQWAGAGDVDRDLLQLRATRGWWDVLERLGVTLLVTREYEHLVIALSAHEGRGRQTHMALPHPSGLVADRERGVVHVAATRNPNQVFTLAPASGALERSDRPASAIGGQPLVPVASRFLPGAMYLHDLALVGGALHANAVGLNAVVELPDGGRERVAWWPRSVEQGGRPDLSRNYLQLNSIAAGPDLAGSFFTASTATPSARRPGHRNYPVDRRGVVFSGATREPVVGGLTRPHSARFGGDGGLWVDDSGYGTLCRIEGDRAEPVAALAGWTRGLAFAGDVAFVGTSRVIPRFRHYAPGLDVERSVCAVHAIDVGTGAVLGSARWPYGNQIFAIDWLPSTSSQGLAFRAGQPAAEQIRRLFYAFDW